MEKSALVVIDLQNDITKNYRDIIDGVNEAIRRAEARGMEIVYIRHNNLSAGTRAFKPGTHGEELVPELRVASEHCFVKSKSSALTSEAFAEFIEGSGVREFFLCGADAAACVKSTAITWRRRATRSTSSLTASPATTGRKFRRCWTTTPPRAAPWRRWRSRCEGIFRRKAKKPPSRMGRGVVK